jgi:ABC-2 type transport system ATP-binding protein
MLQDTGPEKDLTVAECLRLYGGYYADPWSPDELLRMVGLQAQAGQRAGQLSGGQRRRLDLAIALAGRPALLFLDEPTTGFDPAARREAWAGIAALKELGTTIVLTTHYIEEAERLADRVGVLRAGRLVSLGAPDTLTGTGPSRVAFTLPPTIEVTELPAPARAALSHVDKGAVELVTDTPLDLVAVINEWARASGFVLADLEIRRPSLEDAYLQITSEESAS